MEGFSGFLGRLPRFLNYTLYPCIQVRLEYVLVGGDITIKIKSICTAEALNDLLLIRFQSPENGGK